MKAIDLDVIVADALHHADLPVRPCGLNADWSVSAWHLGPSDEPNRTGNDIYILDDEDDTADRFSVVRRQYPPETDVPSAFANDEIIFIAEHLGIEAAAAVARAALTHATRSDFRKGADVLVDGSDYVKVFTSGELGIGITVQARTGVLVVSLIVKHNETWRQPQQDGFSSFWVRDFDVVWTDLKLWLEANAEQTEDGWKLSGRSEAMPGHNEDCPSRAGGECVYPCLMQATDNRMGR